MRDLPAFISKPFREAVEKGVEFLDEEAPGWYHKIDISKLRMDSATSCICGQIFVDNIIRESGFDWVADEYGTMVAYGNYGFVTPERSFAVDRWLIDNGISSWEILAWYWIEVIEKRIANED